MLKHVLIILFLLALASSAQGEIVTKIFKLEKPTNKSDNYQVLALRDGRVYEVSPHDQAVLAALRQAVKTRALVDLTLAGEGPKGFGVERIVEASILPERPSIKPLSYPLQDYVPTDLGNMSAARKLFSQLLPRSKWFTQCFNRAHIWNRQMHKDHGVKSEKIFIFYTQKYRREINKKWWFHVAPLVTVGGEKIVLDKEFTSGPLSESEWEFIFNLAKGQHGGDCKRIGSIGEYENQANNQNEYCNIQVSSMYYWEPSELRDLETEGAQKREWIDWEIRTAARDVYRTWRSVYQKYRP